MKYCDYCLLVNKCIINIKTMLVSNENVNQIYSLLKAAADTFNLTVLQICAFTIH